MVLLRHRPGPPLDAWVDCFWYARRDGEPRRRERALPSGAVDLVIDLRGDPLRCHADADAARGLQFRDAVVHGAHAHAFVLEGNANSTVIGVHFRPGGATPLLGTPAAAYADAHLALEDLWGRSRAQLLRERLLEAESPAAMFAVLEREFTPRITRPVSIHPAVAHALRCMAAAPASARIEAIRAASGYGSKRFVELFRATVGLNPKRYCRVRRFGLIAARVATGGQVDWARLAAECGYADQSHLNRDFRAFAGLTPGACRPVAPDRPLHLALEP